MPEQRESGLAGPPEENRTNVLISWIRARLKDFGLLRIVVVLGYLVLVFSGTTTSSLGYAGLQANPSDPTGLTIGSPRSIRSDEFLTYTPIDLGFLTAGGGSTSTPLAQEVDLINQLPSGGIGESLVFFDGALLRLGPILPDAMLFAAYWWLPTLLLLLCMPAWLRRLGCKPELAWLAAIAVLLAPSAAWWSLMPVRIMSFTMAGALALLCGVDRIRSGRRVTGWTLVVLAGVLWARMGTFYVPWSIVLCVPVVLATFAYLLWDRNGRRTRLAAVAVSSLSTLVMFGWILLENLPSLRSELATVYPGLRLATGASLPLSRLFSAPLLGQLSTSPKIVGSNASEISQAYAFCAVWAVVIWLTVRRKLSAQSAALAVYAAATIFWLLWCSFDWGALGMKLPIVNRVPPARAAQTVGFLAIIFVALVLSRISDRGKIWGAVTAAICCAGITVAAGIGLRGVIPSTSTTRIVLAAVVVALVVFMVTYMPRNIWILSAAALAMASLVYSVNPVQVGLGGLRSGPVAQRILAAGDEARADGTWWVSDSMNTDALLLSDGVPLISGHQVTGPVREEWAKLDPTGRYEEVWNRGASYLLFAFADVPAPVIELGKTRDQIVVTVDPCQLPPRGFDVSHVMSTRALSFSCLVPVETVNWVGVPRYIYQVEPPKG